MKKTGNKLAIVSLIAVMALSMAACTSKKTETTAETTAVSTTAETTVAKTTVAETMADTVMEETSEEDDASDEDTSMPEGAAVNADGSYKDGVYDGIGTGNNGDIKLEVTVDGGRITSVVIKDHEETEGLYEEAEKKVIEDIIQKQTPGVDAVTSATNTSNGIMEAVANALGMIE